MITAVGVVVPACDEQERIDACLRSVRRSLKRLPTETAVAVTVVLDRCSDHTPERVATTIADWPEAEAVLAHDTLSRPGAMPIGSGTIGSGNCGAGADVGALRALGLRRALARLAPHPPDRTWLLSTDADTTVPADWACAHVRLAAAGAHGVAGLAELDDGSHLPTEVLERYRTIVAHGLHGRHHDHVYGANLGFRADAYLAVGGFPLEGPGEDHGLWWRLASAGFRLEHPTTLRVSTSARVRGRAEGGLADLLHSLTT
ncbi:MAG TPA: hypothetical protein VM942_00795 [Acidimicrobiales bacterium]|nr:hypothetical protein [Acidimicrobiales bacterium]